MAVGMAVEAGDAAARLLRAAILGLVELLLRKRRQQQAQTLDLLGIEDAVEQLVVIVDGDQLALRDVTQVGPRGQEHRWGEFGQEMVGNVELEVEAGEIASLLLLDFLDLELREHHAAFRMIGMGQRIKSRREEVPVANFRRTHARQLIPGRSRRQLDPHAFLQRLAARHGGARRGAVGEVIAFGQQISLALLDRRLRRLHARHDRRECLLDVDRHIAGRATLRLLLGVGKG